MKPIVVIVVRSAASLLACALAGATVSAAAQQVAPPIPAASSQPAAGAAGGAPGPAAREPGAQGHPPLPGAPGYLGQERVKARQQRQAAAPERMVDLNNASLAELKTLPTIGEAEARKIVAHRPYVSKVDLVTRAGLPEGVYLAVRYHTMVGAPGRAAKEPLK